jgi:hypothetical protein
VIWPCVTPTHPFAAAKKAGPLMSTPAALIISIDSCPWAFGSGKFDMPWPRRQWANERKACLDGP